MGIYDRDYSREPADRTSFGGARMWSFNTWLIVINIAVFLVDNAMEHSLYDWGYFSIDAAIAHLQLWRFLSFQFLHQNIQHILYNMIALFFFGPMIESYLGSKRYLAFYLLCGFAGPMMYMLLWALGLFIHVSYAPMVGASAGIFGVLIAAAHIAPNTQVLIYGVIPVRLRVLAWILLGIAAFTVMTEGTNAGGEAAHLGGAAAGYLLIKNERLLNFVDFRPRSRMRYRP